MRLTRRGYGVVGVAATLLVVGAAAERPLALVGAGAVCAWLLVALFRAGQRFAATDGSIALALTADRRRIRPNSETEFRLSIDSSEATHPITVGIEWPVGVDGDARTVFVDPRRSVTEETATCSIPVAGTYELPRLSCTYRSADGLFSQDVSREESLEIDVTAPSPDDIHVGAGGDPLVGTYGDHTSGQRGTGTNFIDIRRYVPGDSVSRIDWNATARFSEAYVREFENETVQQTRLFVDNRACMWEGPQGRTKADYLREVLLGVLTQVEEANDPVGLTVLDDDGLRTDLDYGDSTVHYRDCRRTLTQLSKPMSGVAAESLTTAGPEMAQRTAGLLAAREDTFARTLRPYFESPESYVLRLDSKPVFEALRRKAVVEKLRGWSVLCTDDTHPQETREAVKQLVDNGGRVTVFLAPSALFESDSADGSNRAYDRLVDFESFRKSIDVIPNVRAYEVAPNDRLQSVLDAGRTRR
ncbi:DUF58 domain-containing protein [Halogeometricum sp. S1BR25-6]|uniref:DUF58 domain-containing protein n=1 Tax=Halogeometricum salsisoli TaxID=2950536 RepID=A0ABU2GJL3_9EURY|nr:DUF58 domain-containing protein [Halogeometricum sp. S1BR25-6]MDS0300263.1 DUF58 domain-containing protein [Halogeometricum sp. S1BR25-6]